MYTIRQITRYEWSWLKSSDFHDLFSQLTKTSLMTDAAFKEWFIKTLSEPKNNMYGVFSDTYNQNKLVGLGVLLIEEKYYRGKNDKPGKCGHIEDIIIDKEHRGRLLGQRLLTFIKKSANERNCYKIQLHCDPKLENFYKKLNFTSSKSSMEIYL